VPIHGWGSDVDGFRRATGFSAPIASDPGLSVSTGEHPVTVLYDKATKTHTVAAVGSVSYDSVRVATRTFAEGRRSSAPARGSS
jgi:hypothetical protein